MPDQYAFAEQAGHAVVILCDLHAFLPHVEVRAIRTRESWDPALRLAVVAEFHGYPNQGWQQSAVSARLHVQQDDLP